MFGTNAGSGWGQPQQQPQQQQQQQPGAFGQPAQQGGFGAFGGGGAFGQPQQQPTTTFGASTSTGTGAFGGFGQQPKPAGFGATTGAFGAAPAAGGFGATTFGAPAATGAFGAPQPAAGGGLFGSSQPAQGGGAFGSGSALFGAPKPAAGGFGTSNALVPAVQNGTQSPAYEATQERDTTGAQSVVLHYQSISCMPAYKNQSFEELRVQDYAAGRKTAQSFGQPAFGPQPTQPAAGGLFGSTPGAGAFGQAAPANPTPAFGAGTFGQQQQPPAFGATTGGAFGQTPGATGAFGQQAAGTFGQPAQPTGGLFGSTATTGAFGQPPAQQTGAFGAFGANNNNQPKPAGAFGGFGATTTPATGAFGAGAFGQQTQQQQPATGAFGQSTQQTGAFGAFGANNNNQPKPGGLFGSTTTTPAFGQQAQGQDNKPAGGLFGTGFGQTQQPATGAFGQSTQQPQQQATGLFGQPAAGGTTGGLFGSTAQQPAQQGAFGSGGGLFGPKPATPGGTTGGLFGSAPAAGQNPLMPTQQAGGGLFGSTTQQAQQPAAGAFGTSSLFNTKPATAGFGSTPGLFSSMSQPAAPQPTTSLFGQSSSAPLGAMGSIFGSSALGAQQQQQNLVASIDQPVNHALPVFSLLPPGPRAIPASTSVIGAPSPKKPSYLADLPTRSPVPRLGTGAYTPPGANKLRGFASTNSGGALSSSVSTMTLHSSPSRQLSASPFSSSTSIGTLARHPTLSSSLSTMGPEAFATSSSSLSLSGGRRSVKKLVLDKKPGSPAPGDSPVKASASKVTFNPIASARERERERERTSAAGFSEPTPEPEPEPIPPPRRTTTPTPATTLGSAASEPKQSDLADGYWIRPSLAALARATKPVDGLTIGRNGVGSVTFLVPVDLKECPPVAEIPGKVVVLTPKECTVYPDEDSKPNEGSGLNVPARIALEGCWAIDKANRQPIKQDNHPKQVAHLRKLREMPETKFISFDIKSGTWTFTVEHFSKYGLGDDDDESTDGEDARDMDVETSPLKNKTVKHPPPPPASAEKDTSAEGNSKFAARAVPWNMRAGVEAEKVYTMQASLFRVPEARAAAVAETTTTPRRSLFATQPPVSASNSRLAVEELQPSRSNLALKASASNPFASSSSLKALPASQSSRIKFNVPVNIKATGVGSEESVFDAGLSMGRSFRVSFGPGGRLVGAGRLAKPSESTIREPGVKSIVTIRQVPLASADEASLPQNLQKVVRLQFKHSTVHLDDDDIPFASPKPNLRFRHFAALYEPDAKSNDALLWRLLVALFDEIPLRMPQGTENSIRERVHAICRRQALSNWLEAAVASVVDADVQAGSVAQRIFALLSGNQVARAVRAAYDGGNVHLATLIAQHGSDAQLSEDIAAQVDLWREQRAAAQMDPHILRVYALLAGVLDVLPGVRSTDPLESCADVAVTGALDWRRAFGLRLWYGAGATTQNAGLALEEYEAFFQSTKTALPMRAGERDAAYELIRAALRPDVPLDVALVPKTFGGNALDYRMTWHIYVVLSKVLRQRDFADRQPQPGDEEEDAAGHSPTADLITSAYALQLESAGLYPEAVFVLLHLEAANGRVLAVKDLLSRNYTRLTDEHLRELDQLNIPEAWLQESKAALLVSQGNIFDAFQAFIAADQQQRAYELAVDKLVPDAVLREDLELLRTLFSQFNPEAIDGWGMKGKLFIDYIEVMEATPSHEITQAAQQLLAAIPAATTDLEDSGNGKINARWAACRARMISNLLEVTGRFGMRYADRGEIALVDDSSRAKHVSSLAFDSFISVLG
ncbi:hypothetical protein EXIGLDRAFT_753514 [Exidia glandulosa HHB12029]|uniref:Peptidase S59 domain-containing protein n=1 Tax=Exidia glandulosa HHB12029 TaxID=1314781 RepID=A0A165DP32_EXIGL|nr:hypothetical protein EXIGLDRAFT_753514 [Exidia glandulosa HHB12029]